MSDINKEKIRKLAWDMVKTDCQCGADIDSDHQVEICAWHEVIALLDEPEAGVKGIDEGKKWSFDKWWDLNFGHITDGPVVKSALQLQFHKCWKSAQLNTPAPDDRVKALVEAVEKGPMKLLRECRGKPFQKVQGGWVKANLFDTEAALKAMQGE